MEKLTCIIIDEDQQDGAKLAQFLNKGENTEVIGNTSNFKEGVVLANQLEPNILFLSLKGDDLSAFKTLEKIKKQPTMVLIVNKTSSNVSTFEANGLNYLTKPIAEKDLQSLFAKLNQTHNQLAQKMQGLLGKLKFED